MFARNAKGLTALILALALVLAAVPLMAAPKRPTAKPGELPEDLRGVEVARSFVPYPGQRVGFMQHQVGVVVIRHGKKGKAFFAAEGDTLFKGDIVYTLSGSRCRLNIKDEDIINLSEDATFQIKSIFRDRKTKKRRSLFSMVRGKAMFYVLRLLKYKDAQADVETPTATAGIRGTKFALEIRYKSPNAKNRGIMLASAGNVPLGNINLAAALDGGVEVIGTCLDGNIYLQHNTTGNVVLIPAGFTAAAGGVDVGSADTTDPGYLQQLMQDTSVGPAVTGAVSTVIAGGEGGPVVGGGDGREDPWFPPEDGYIPQPPEYDYYGFYGAMMTEYIPDANPIFADKFANYPGSAVQDPHHLVGNTSYGFLINSWVLTDIAYPGLPFETVNQPLTQTIYGFYFTHVLNDGQYWPVAFMYWGHWRSGDFTINPDVGIRPMAGGWVEGARPPEATLSALLGSSQIYNYGGFSSGHLWVEPPVGGWYEEILRGNFSATIDFSVGDYGEIQNFALNAYGPNYSVHFSNGSSLLDEFGNFSLASGTYEFDAAFWGSRQTASSGNAFGALFGVDSSQNSVGGTWFADGTGLYANGVFGGLHDGSPPPYPYIPVGWYNGMVLNDEGGLYWYGNYDNTVPGSEPLPQSAWSPPMPPDLMGWGGPGGHFLTGGTNWLWTDDLAAGPGISGYLRSASLGTPDYDIGAAITTHVYGSGAGITYGWWETANFSIDPIVGSTFYIPWGGWVELARTTPSDIAEYAAADKRALYTGNTHGYVFNDNTQTGSTVDGAFHAWLNFATGMLEGFDLYAYSASGQHYVAITGASGDLQADGDVVITGGGRWLVDGISAISGSVAASLAGVGAIGFAGGWNLDAGTAYSTGVFAAGVDAFYIPGDTPKLFYGTNIMLNQDPTGTTFAEFFWSDGPGFDDLGYGMLSPWTAGTGAQGFAFFNNAIGRDGAEMHDVVYSPVGPTHWIGDFRSSYIDIWSFDEDSWDYSYPGGGEYMDWGVYWSDPFTLTDYATGDTLTLDIRWGSGFWLSGNQTSAAELASLHSGAASYTYGGFSRAYLYYQHPSEWLQVEEIMVGQFSADINFGAGTYGQVSNYQFHLKGPTYALEFSLPGTLDLNETGYYTTGFFPTPGCVLNKNGADVDGITSMDIQGNVFGIGAAGTGGQFVATGYNLVNNVFINGIYGGQAGGSPPQPPVGVGYYTTMVLETDGTNPTGFGGIFRTAEPQSYDVTTQRFSTDTPGDFFIAKDDNNDPNSGEGAVIVAANLGDYSNPSPNAPVSGGPLGSFSTAGGHEYMDWGEGYFADPILLTGPGGAGDTKLVDAPQGSIYWLNGERTTIWYPNGLGPYTYFYSGPAYGYIFNAFAPLGTPESAQPMTGNFWSQVTIGGTSQIDMMNIFVQGSDNWVWVKDVGPIPINGQFDFNAMFPGAAVSGTQYLDVYLAGSMFGPGFDGMGGWWYTDPAHENTWVNGIFAGEQLAAQPEFKVGYYKGILVSYDSDRDPIYQKTFQGGPIPTSVPWLCLDSVSGGSDILNIAGPHLNPGLSGELQFVQINTTTIENAAAALNTTVVQNFPENGNPYMSYGKWNVEFASTWSTYGVRPQAGLWMEGVRTPYDDLFIMASSFPPLTTFYTGPVDGYLFHAGEYYEEALKGTFNANIVWGQGTATLTRYMLTAYGPNFEVIYDAAAPSLGLDSSGSFTLDDNLGTWAIGPIAGDPLLGTGVVDGSLFGSMALGMGGEWWVQNTGAGYYAVGVFAGEQASRPQPMTQVPVGFYTGIMLNNTDNSYAQTYRNEGDVEPQSADVAQHWLDSRDGNGILDAEDMTLGQGFSGDVVRADWYDGSSGNTFDTYYTGFARPAVTTTVDGSASGSGEYMWWGRWMVGPFEMRDYLTGTVSKDFQVPGWAGFWVEGERTGLYVRSKMMDYRGGAMAKYTGNAVFGYMWDEELQQGAALTGSFSAMVDFGFSVTYTYGQFTDFDLSATGTAGAGATFHTYTASIMDAIGGLDVSGNFTFNNVANGTWEINRNPPVGPPPSPPWTATYGQVVGSVFGAVPTGLGGIWEMGYVWDPGFQLHATGNFAGEIAPEPTALYNGMLIYEYEENVWNVASYYYNSAPQAPGDTYHRIYQVNGEAGHYIHAANSAPGGFGDNMGFVAWLDTWSTYGTFTYSAGGVPITTTTLGSYSTNPTYLTWGDWETGEFAMTYSAPPAKDFKVIKGYWMEGDRTPEVVLATRAVKAYYGGNDVSAFYFENGYVTDTLDGTWGTWVDFASGALYGFNMNMTGSSTYAYIMSASGALDQSGFFEIDPGSGTWSINGLEPSARTARGAIWGPGANAAAGLVEMGWCLSVKMLTGAFAGEEKPVQRLGYYNALLVHDDGTGNNWVTAGIYHNLDPDDPDSKSHTIVYPPSTDKLVSEDTGPTAEPGFSGRMTEASWNGSTNSNVDKPINTFSTASYGEYLSWGYWDKGVADTFTIDGTGLNFYVPRGVFVEGTPTQPAALATLQAANASYNYTGGASGYIWNDSTKSGNGLLGTFGATLNFGPGTVTNFGVNVTGGGHAVNINSASGNINPTGDFSINTATGTWLVNGANAAERDARGFVAGPAADAVGGIWKAGTPTQRSMGEFHGEVDGGG